jgi:hypothetical protein
LGEIDRVWVHDEIFDGHEAVFSQRNRGGSSLRGMLPRAR